MSEPNNYTEENFDANVDVDLATAATEEFNYTIGDAVAPETEAQDEEVIARLKGDSPEFPAHAVGAGFVEYGRSLSDAIGQMQELSVKFLETRVAGWRELIVLVDSVEAVDFANAGEVG